MPETATRAEEPASRHALVVGASGLLGPHLIDRLSASPGWRVTTLSRRAAGPDDGACPHLSADLLDAERLVRLAPKLAPVTHVFFGSRALGEGYRIDHDANVAMLANLLAVLEVARGAPKHIQLMHGLKWYGFNLASAKIPGRESDPPARQASFYAPQRELLIGLAERNGWTWSTIRPHLVCGVATESPSNIVSVIGTFAAILKALGEPLWFPGPEASFDAVLNVTDVDLLTEAMEWAATEPRCAGEDFNILNGDCFRWRDVWPAVAAAFGMKAAGARGVKLAAFMADKAPLWQRIVAENGLVASPLAAMGDWDFADASFAVAWHQVAAVTKAHRFGFTAMVDSEEMLLSYLRAYRERRLLP
ncbi:NAD-dependent epimerase/dehydratase family protein [Afifella sp. IM 167]|uniref:NAD-dependent epimerase/dehydratase family protein n=1 Tax=Afifella sp. IM 167 TaxID=2033586 RepID=UPI001CCFAB85|nr:NAD-dependent epimerase/dehydratase family protein [Afifella sp. IM 167]